MKPSEGLEYEPTPTARAYSPEEESVLRQVNEYGTYEIQRTADTDEFFPAIAQGLPKKADFAIRAKNMEP